MPAAVVQFFILGGNQGAAKPSIGWVRAKGGETLVFLLPDHPHALIKIIGCFVCTTCPLYNRTLFFADSILKKFCSTNGERNHSFYITIIDEGFWGLQVWLPSMTPLYNNYWTIDTPSLVNSLPNIRTWWMMDAIGVSSMTNPLDKALWANLVCTEKLSFSQDAAGRDWEIHKLWVLLY